MLLPEDDVFVDINGTKTPAIVRIIDPFLEIRTVEIEKKEVVVSFDSVVAGDEESAAKTPAKKRRQAKVHFGPSP